MSKNYISTLEMSREDWLNQRHKGVGSSDMAKALGLSRWGTPYELWQEKTQPVKEWKVDDYLRQKLRSGLAMEPVIAQLFEEDYGFKTREDHKIRFHPEHNFILANCDRMLVSRNGDGPGLYEIKNIDSWSWRKWEMNPENPNEKMMPMEYWIQMQTQFLVTGYKWGYFGVFVDGFMLKCWECNPDYEYHKTMIKMASEFWNYVETKTPPPAMNASDIEKLFPKHEEGKYIQVDNDIYNQVIDYHQLDKEAKELEEKIETIKDDLKGLIGEAEGLRKGNLTLATCNHLPGLILKQ